MEIDGSTAVVTGGGSGIGERTARLLTTHGVRCLIIDRDKDRAARVCGEIGGSYFEADVSNELHMAEAFSLASEMGNLRVLVNAAGIGSGGRVLGRDGTPSPLGKFDRVLAINLSGTFNGIRLFAAELSKAPIVDGDGQRGVVVNISSVAAFDGQIGQAAYAASKAGIVGMTLPIARDLASLGIRVNTIAPGLVDTPIYGEGESADKFKARLSESVLFPRRLGHADEIATMTLELIRNDYVNGETIRVDGGIRMPPA